MVSSIIKLLYYLTDFWFGYWLLIKKQIIGSTLILFDRYYYDIYVDPLRYRYGGPYFLLKLLGSLIPKPELIFVINVPVDNLIERKQELPREVLEDQCKKYRKLPTEVFVYMKIIDGGENIVNVVRCVKSIMIKYLHERYILRYGKGIVEISTELVERFTKY